jgi:Zn-dependent peptidase ImmA (M78 family)/transcriptional regulator with XRE-family HTH domain
MKIKSYGFVGENLTRAREVRSMSQAELARRLEITRQSISQYESNANSPTVETLTRIAQELKLPTHYFLRVPPKSNADPVFNRVHLSAATKTARKAAERRYEWLKEIVTYLREYVNFPRVHFPQYDVPTDPYKITNELIEELAAHTRRFWGLGDGVISNVVWLLENNGAIVARYYLDAEKYDAFSVFSNSDKTPYIILGADKGIAVRSRFDASHELGHIILHQRIDKTRLNRSADFSLIERQAHRFASAFLLPSTSYMEDLVVPSLDTFRVKKSKWRVSIQTQIHRCQDLGIISSEHATRLWKTCNRKGWKYKEPMDDELLVEQPRLLSRAMRMLLDENVQTRTDIASALPFALNDISELTGLPLEVFNGQANNSIVSLKSRFQNDRQSNSESVTSDTPRNTVQLADFRRR